MRVGTESEATVLPVGTPMTLNLNKPAPSPSPTWQSSLLYNILLRIKCGAYGDLGILNVVLVLQLASAPADVVQVLLLSSLTIRSLNLVSDVS